MGGVLIFAGMLIIAGVITSIVLTAGFTAPFVILGAIALGAIALGATLIHKREFLFQNKSDVIHHYLERNNIHSLRNNCLLFKNVVREHYLKPSVEKDSKKNLSFQTR